MSPVAIKLLGGFAADVDGQPVDEKAWRLKKARELVKLLALARDHRLHREQAMDALWRDRSPAAAANNLHQAVHIARRALGAEAIVVRDEMIFLDATIDIDVFEQAASEARRVGTPAAARAALAQYGGELLPENRYEDWAAARRDELATTVDVLSSVGAASALRGLPTESSSFVGRAHELSDLVALIERTRLLTLTGTGGAGKTRLALELARGVESSYADGAALAELASVSDPALVTDATALALDVRSLAGQSLREAVGDFLAPRNVLLVLDNCEHVLGACSELVGALLRAAPRLTVLTTSREPLHIPGEIVFRVPSLAIPDPEQQLALDAVLRYEAVRLFVDRAVSANPAFEVDVENAADVARICFRLDGLPLALELAAGRVGALGPGAIADRLDDRFRLLRAGTHSAPTRQQTLQATLDWSHDLLSSEERILLRRLGVFAGGFTLEAAEETCAGEGLARESVADIVARLVEKSLVVGDGGGRDRRYRLLETVRAYARERLAAAGETAALSDAHARWALALAEQERDSPRLDSEAANIGVAFEALLPLQPIMALRLCVAVWPLWLRRIDLANARRRFAAALDAAPERSRLRVEALLSASALDMRGGSLASGSEYAEMAYALASELDEPRARWRTIQFLGEFGIAADDTDRAVFWLERGLELTRHEGFAAAEAICVYSFGIASWIHGDIADAEARLTRSLERFRELAGSPERVPSPLNLSEMRDGDRLRVVFEETLQPYLEITCDAAVGYVLANLASIARKRGDLARARELLTESASCLAELADPRGQAEVLARFAYLDLAEGSLDDARRCFEQALRLRTTLNDRRGVGLALSGLGIVETAAGEHEQAERHLVEARDLFRRGGDRWGLVSAFWRIADLDRARERLEDAEAALDEAEAVLAEIQRPRWLAHTHAARAEIALLRGHAERGAELLQLARELYAATHDSLGLADVEARIAGLARASAKPMQRRGA